MDFALLLRTTIFYFDNWYLGFLLSRPGSPTIEMTDTFQIDYERRHGLPPSLSEVRISRGMDY
jgi:hypothetical protein